MSIVNGIFNAIDYDPTQGLPKHPLCNKEPAIITDTQIKPGKDGVGMQFVITFTTKLGSINKNYQIDFPNSKEIEDISRRQLSAVCHATGTYQVSLMQGGMELRNKQLLIDVTVQAKDDKYNEVSRVYSPNGEMPTRVPAAQTGNPQPMQQPMQQPGFAPQTQQNGFQPPAMGQGFQPAPNQPPQGFAPQAGAPMPDNQPAWAQRR